MTDGYFTLDLGDVVSSNRSWEDVVLSCATTTGTDYYNHADWCRYVGDPISNTISIRTTTPRTYTVDPSYFGLWGSGSAEVASKKSEPPEDKPLAEGDNNLIDLFLNEYQAK